MNPSEVLIVCLVPGGILIYGGDLSFISLRITKDEAMGWMKRRCVSGTELPMFADLE